jgi:hypothetical protein
MLNLDADKRQSNLLVLFIPSADRFGKSLGKKVQDRWVRRAMTVLGELLGGATAFPRGFGVWRDDAQDGKLVWDKPVLIPCYTNEQSLESHSPAIRDLLIEMGAQTRQGAVGFVIDRDYFEISFPLKGT